MKNLESSFEDKMRSAFENAELTPPDHIWKGVSAHLDKGPKRYTAAWIAAAVVLVLSSSTLGGWLLFNSEDSVDTNPKYSVVQNEINKTTQNQSNKIESSQVDTELSTSSEVSNSQTIIQKNQEGAIERKEVSPLRTKDELKITSSSAKQTSSVKQHVVISKSDDSKISKNEKSLEITEKSTSLDTQSTSKIASNVEENSSSIIESTSILELAFLHSNVELIGSLEKIPLEQSNGISSANEAEIADAKDPKWGVWLNPTIKYGSLSPNYSVNPLYFEHNTVLGADSSAFRSDLAQNTQTGKEFAAGINILVKKNVKWAIGTGVEIVQQSNSIASTPMVLKVIEVPDISGSTSLDTIRTYYSNALSIQKTYVGIPLYVRRTLGKGTSKFIRTAFEGGLNTYYLLAEKHSSKLDQFEYQMPVSKKIQSSLLLGISIETNVTDRSLLYITPYYQASLMDIYSSKGLQSKPDVYGIRMGFVWKLKP